MPAERLSIACIGAGNLTKGLLYPLFTDEGHDVSIICMTDKSLNALRTGYTFVEASERGGKKEYSAIPVHAIRAVPSELWAGFNVITTAVGRDNIFQVADILSEQPIGDACLILCENDITCFRSIHAVSDNIYQAVVDRIIYSDDHGAVIGEEYYSFSIFNNRLKNRQVLPECVRIGTNFFREHITKLYLMNALHSIIAWAAHAEGAAHINNALQSTTIKTLAEEVSKELTGILTHRFSTDLPDEFFTFAARSLSRFANKQLSDPVARVGRNALRKLGKNERIFRPILYARKYGLAHDALLRGAAYGQLYHMEVEDTINSGVMDELYNYIDA